MTDPRVDPVHRSRREAQAAYDRLSWIYDLVENPFERPLRDRAVASLPIRSGDRILEIGCGTGHALVPLARRARREGLVVGLDLSAGMLSVAARRLDRAGHVPTEPRLVMADAVYLPLADSTVDVVFCSFTLELFAIDDMNRVLAEVRRVLRHGGHLGIVSLVDARPANLIQRLYGWVHRHFERYADCRPIPARDLVEAAGFEIVSHRHDAMWGLPVATIVATL